MSSVLTLKGQFGRWSIDFMTNLPLCGGKNAIMMCIEGLFGFVRVVPCYMGEGELSAEQVATLFFNRGFHTTEPGFWNLGI